MVVAETNPEFENLSLDVAFDRAAYLRADEQRLSELLRDSSTRILRIFDGRFAWVQDSEPRSDPRAPAQTDYFFLGLDENQVAYFAEHHEHDDPDSAATLRDNDWPDFERSLATHAVALTNWHGTHPKCPRCGGETHPILSGSVRRCQVDGTDHHPRSDPAIISLVCDRDDRLLLGRQRTWPERRFSAFAGFVEPGESLEDCLRREIFEECGLKVERPKYLGSQAWPFPGSLMVAFHVVAINVGQERADGDEIAEIKWFTREQLKIQYEREEVLLPPRISIARRMIEHWYGGPLER
ncbi:MAG TPA: NAD(+) diphosphatase [Candidatus Nanopelagicaceae bacterium]|nr:NAD(+) diphosphatase [Candidatus Nanopelagicaceae bacterium]